MAKDDTDSALHRYYAKELEKEKRSRNRATKRNGKPEKELEKSILKWASQKAIHLHVIEAKAVYSQSAGRYLRGQAEAGIPDLIGNCGGLSMWIELKSPGRRGTLKQHQREFLVQKVKQGCFSCCVDSVEQLDRLLAAFLSTPFSGRVQLLLDHLPKSRHPSNHDDRLF